MKKINISINENLLAKIDDYCEANFLPRSTLFCVSAQQYINAQEMMALVRKMSLVIDKIADNGTIDDESSKQLEDFRRAISLLSGAR